MPAKKDRGTEAVEAAAPKKGRTSRAAATEGGTTRAPARSRGTATRKSDDLKRELREFAAAHRDGWNHDEWNDLVARLAEKGYDVSNPGEIGRQLEQQRVAVRLEGVQGVGPAKIRKLAEEFGTLWELRHADTGRIAAVGGLKPEVAERVQESVR
jgi:hypothetical protein